MFKGELLGFFALLGGAGSGEGWLTPVFALRYLSWQDLESVWGARDKAG